ncbi:MAG: hypothetical protein CVV33_03345 [Methanomicrobiales archaeon HGW-Methanomicrobiales-4]|nr:MAG: hypothetical protein CVV33_03345 [Methanomicrobiales archaeon HGW-Methanomicrobiales-4]
MKGITIVLVMGLIALAMVFTASAAGQGVNGKMLQNGTGSGINIAGCQNPDCPQGYCLNNQARPLDGTGNQYGGQMFRNGTGQGCRQTGNANISCTREDCPNNGTPKRDGTGLKSGNSGMGCGNGGQSGQGCGRHFQG